LASSPKQAVVAPSVAAMNRPQNLTVVPVQWQTGAMHR
jgi:hypothetical protein